MENAEQLVNFAASSWHTLHIGTVVNTPEEGYFTAYVYSKTSNTTLEVKAQGIARTREKAIKFALREFADKLI